MNKDGNSEEVTIGEVLLEEIWQPPEAVAGEYRLIVGRPRVYHTGTEYQCPYHVEGLYDRPRRHLQESPALAVRDAISTAADDLFAAGAAPRSVPT